MSAGELAARSSPSLLKEKQPAAPPEPAPSRDNVLQCAESPAEQVQERLLKENKCDSLLITVFFLRLRFYRKDYMECWNF